MVWFGHVASYSSHIQSIDSKEARQMVGDICFQQLHIEIGRNATDDFNPFHDKNRWSNVVNNPFGGPIVLGFQLECLIEQQMRLYRTEHGEAELIDKEALHFSNYDFKFANAVKADQAVNIAIKDSRFREGDNPTLANRVTLQADGRLAMAGHKRESRLPLTLPATDLSSLGDLSSAQDRSFIADSGFYLKRKYLTTSNAKNFLSSSLVEQADFIDEIANRVSFPEIFPCAWLSNALLERASQQGHDFELMPMVYKSHAISIDRTVLNNLRSNDVLHLLSRHADPVLETPVYECFGVVGSGERLFNAVIKLMPLAETL